MDPALIQRFDVAMRQVYSRAKSEAGYDAKVFLGMLSSNGGLETARRLLASDKPSAGFVALWERQRIDLAVENVVLRYEFAALFTDDEREIARRRLRDHGFDVDEDSRG